MGSKWSIVLEWRAFVSTEALDDTTLRPQVINDILLLAKNRRKPADLRAKGSSDVLRAVINKLLHTRHDIVEQRRPVHKGAKTRNLACDCGPDLGFVVLE